MLCLLLTALIWGFAFVAQVQGMDSMSPIVFNATRFTLGALSLVPILLWQRVGGAAVPVKLPTPRQSVREISWFRPHRLRFVCSPTRLSFP